MIRFLFLLLFISVSLSLPSVAKRFTHGFRIAKMALEFPANPRWDVPITAEIESILQQPFSYLGKGAQCYVFESRDRQYVIKLFRYDRPPIPSKVIQLFNACKLAYDELREETALLYIHLNPTHSLPLLHCRDSIGRSHTISLDLLRFAVQKKCLLFYDALEEALSDPEQIQSRVDAFLHLLKKRVERKIVNADRSLASNFGFLGDVAIELDFGNYRLCSTFDAEKEMHKYTSQLKSWLLSHGIEGEEPF